MRLDDWLYVGSILATITAYAIVGYLMWQGVELVYWIYCKITGKEY